MSRLAAARLAVCIGLGTLVAGCAQKPAPESSAKETATVASAPSAAERGKYLVTILGCNDCHTPLQMGPNGPAPDMTRMLSGHPESMQLPPPPKLDAVWMWAGTGTNTAFIGPWGTTYSANLTPDQNTGIGIWTEEMFLTALKSGKHMGTSREIQPPMPWRWYRNMTDEDLEAIYAYLKTVPAIANHVPDYAPPGGSGN
jgi:mono/diheme cytochrome c family protein